MKPDLPKAQSGVTVDSRPSLQGRSRCYQRVKRTQRFLSDCSMGQHYHVFFHKRRYSYGSPVCGCLSLIVYALLLYYMGLKIAGVVMKSEYVNVEQFKPINFTDNGITLGHFFETVELQIVYDMVQNDTVIYYCPFFQDMATLRTENPSKIIYLNLTSDYTNLQCNAYVNETYFSDPTPLQTNFTMYLSCPNCTIGYQVSLREWLVN